MHRMGSVVCIDIIWAGSLSISLFIMLSRERVTLYLLHLSSFSCPSITLSFTDTATLLSSHCSFISGCCHVLSILQLLWMEERRMEGKAYKYIYSDLSLWHDIDVAVVQGKGHVSENRASVFDDRQSFILNATLRRTVNTNLKEKEENIRSWAKL